MRKLPSTPSLKRTVELTKPKVAIYIVCEGINTEPHYFTECVKHYSAGLVELTIIPGAGVPDTLVKRAIALRDELLQKKRRSPDSFSSCFRVWTIFDRDEHPLVEESILLAKEHKIDVAFSDPCFEIWPILHLQNYGAQDHRHEVQKKLAEMMNTYEHDKGAIIDYEAIKDNFQIAYDRASRLNLARTEENCPNGCPSTTVGELVLKIKQNGRE
ncbi:RloB family protein [Pseudomonas gessardii]|uniref:RloB family protein n=1 Tax=Pseudomonas gessardii TaxID=78544 RepID=UPI0014754AB2|nr:RloB family protein [Pseudomonas gessardii]NNA93456.1 RloB domain-containing protein [Pseudomonas gessardii]